jgi:hypothetical protein
MKVRDQVDDLHRAAPKARLLFWVATSPLLRERDRRAIWIERMKYQSPRVAGFVFAT